MTALTIPDLDEGKLMMDFNKKFTTSANPTELDPLGRSRMTLQGLEEYAKGQTDSAVETFNEGAAELMDGLNAEAAVTATGINRTAAEAAAASAAGSEAGSVDARAGSEAARDQAILAGASAGTFPTRTAGLVQTAEGGYFWSPDGAAAGFSALWRKVSGAAVAQNIEQPLRGYLDGLITYKTDRSGYVAAIEDALGQVWIGLRIGGKIDLGPISDVGPLLTSLAVMLGLKPSYDSVAQVVLPGDRRSGVYWAVKLADLKMPIYVDTLGNFWVGQTNITALFGTAALIDGMKAFFTPTLSDNVYCPGDSLDEGAGSTPGSGNYPYQLSQLYEGTISVVNGGIGGQLIDQICDRAGGNAALITLSGNQIPADTSSIAVTPVNINLLTGTDPARSIKGWVYGVDGSMVYATMSKAVGTNALTFARQVAGSAVATNPVTPFFVDMSLYGTYIVLLGGGTNNIGVSTTVEQFMAAISAFVDHLPTIGPKRYRRWGWHTLWPSTNSAPGSDAWNKVQDFNNAMKAKYPFNVIDTAAALMRSGNGSTQDNSDIANGWVPSSLRSDEKHLNDAGYLIKAQESKRFITLRKAMNWSIY